MRSGFTDYSRCGKQVLANGVHFADGASEANAETIRNALILQQGPRPIHPAKETTNG